MIVNLAVGIALSHHGLGPGLRLGSGLALQRSLSLVWGPRLSSGLGPNLKLLLKLLPGLQPGPGMGVGPGLLLLLIL